MDLIPDLHAHTYLLLDHAAPSIFHSSTDATSIISWQSPYIQVPEPQMGPLYNTIGAEFCEHPNAKEYKLQLTMMPNQVLREVNGDWRSDFSTNELQELRYQLINKEFGHPNNAMVACSSPVITSLTAKDHFFQSSSSAQSSSDVESAHLIATSPSKSSSSTLGGSYDSPCSEGQGFGKGQLTDHVMDFAFDQYNTMELTDTMFSESMEASMNTLYLGGGLLLQGNSIDNRFMGANGQKNMSFNSESTELGELQVFDNHVDIISNAILPNHSLVQGTGIWESHDIVCDETLSCPANSNLEGGLLSKSSYPLKEGGFPTGSVHDLNWQNISDGKPTSGMSCLSQSSDSNAENYCSVNVLHSDNSEKWNLQMNVNAIVNTLCDSIIDAQNNGAIMPKNKTLVEPRSYSSVDYQHEGSKPEMTYDDFCLVRLLIGLAEALVAHNMNLALVLLARLKELVSLSGSSMQRVSAYFCDGFQLCVDGGSVLHEGNNISHIEVLSAFQVLHEISPYIKFGHFTANQAILEAVEGEKQVHIVDFEIMEGIQWPPLMQALVLRRGGPPRLHITALCRHHGDYGMASTHATGRRLSEFASSLDLPFSFSMVKVDDEQEGFDSTTLKVMKGEVLIVNCMLHLPHARQRKAALVVSFLGAMKKLSPKVLTLVEEQLGYSNTAHYLSETLHHYSAILESLDACLSHDAVARMLVERVYLGPRIRTAVACWSDGASLLSSLLFRRGPAVLNKAELNWCSVVRSMGFTSTPLSPNNSAQARLLLGLYTDGFKVDEESNRLLLAWRSRTLFAASVWG